MGSIYRRRYRTADGTIKESPTLWIKYFRDGKPMRESANTDKESEAKRLLKLREGDVARGVPITPKVGRVKLDELLDDVLTDYRINGKRSIRDIESRLRLHLKPFFGERRASSLTTADVNKYIERRQSEGVTNATVNRETGTLKRAYSLALRAGKVMHAPHIPQLKESAPRAGFFDRDRFESLRRHLSPTLQRIATFAFQTGWRVPSEVLTLQWRQVDFAAGTVSLDPGTTKNDEGRVFYMTAELRTVLEEQRTFTDARQRARRDHSIRLAPGEREAHRGLPQGLVDGLPKGRSARRYLARLPPLSGAQSRARRRGGASCNGDDGPQDALSFRALQHRLARRSEGRGATSRFLRGHNNGHNRRFLGSFPPVSC